jgi:hypothetical protein
MEVFDLGIKILLTVSLLFFMIFFFFCTYWAGEWHPERKLIIGFLVSILYTFWVLAGGFFLLVLISFLVKYFP